MEKKQIAETISFCLEHGSMGGKDCNGICTRKGNAIAKEDEFRSSCPNGECKTGCVVTPLRESLRYLKTEPRLLALRELENSFGHGWEESHLIGDDEDPERFTLVECAWVNGHVINEDGSDAHVQSNYWQEKYNRPYGVRVWEGDEPPTEEKRKAALWNG